MMSSARSTVISRGFSTTTCFLGLRCGDGEVPVQAVWSEDVSDVNLLVVQEATIVRVPSFGPESLCEAARLVLAAAVHCDELRIRDVLQLPGVRLSTHAEPDQAKADPTSAHCCLRVGIPANVGASSGSVNSGPPAGRGRRHGSTKIQSSAQPAHQGVVVNSPSKNHVGGRVPRRQCDDALRVRLSTRLLVGHDLTQVSVRRRKVVTRTLSPKCRGRLRPMVNDELVGDPDEARLPGGDSLERCHHHAWREPLRGQERRRGIDRRGDDDVRLECRLASRSSGDQLTGKRRRHLLAIAATGALRTRKYLDSFQPGADSQERWQHRPGQRDPAPIRPSTRASGRARWRAATAVTAAVRIQENQLPSMTQTASPVSGSLRISVLVVSGTPRPCPGFPGTRRSSAFQLPGVPAPRRQGRGIAASHPAPARAEKGTRPPRRPPDGRCPPRGG